MCMRIPRTIECELLGDVVDTCLPGDVVTVTGEVKVLSVDDYGSGKKDQSLFLLYILVNHVAKCAPCLPRMKPAHVHAAQGAVSRAAATLGAT